MSGKIRKMSASQSLLGLASTAGSLEPNSMGKDVVLVPLDQIRESPENGRLIYDEAKMRELCQSIKERGLDEPVSLVPRDGFFEVIDGHRRYRAHKALGLAAVPCIIRRDLSEEGVRLARLSSIFGKEGLRPYEEARYLQAALAVEGMTRPRLCELAGISSGTLRNRLELLEFPEAVAIHVGAHGFGMDHARLLKPLAERPEALAVAVEVIAETVKAGTPNVQEFFGLISKALVKADLARDSSSPKYRTVRFGYAKFEAEAEKLAHLKYERPYGDLVLVLDVAGFDELVTRAEAAVARAKARREREEEKGPDPEEAKRREKEQRKAEREAKKRAEAEKALADAFFARVKGLEAFTARDLGILARSALDVGLDPEDIPELANTTGIPAAALEAVNAGLPDNILDAAVFQVEPVALLRLLTILAAQRDPHAWRPQMAHWTGKTVEEWLA